MTTVIAAVVDGTVVMAADTLTNVYDRPIVGGARKIRRVKVGTDGEALLAFCGAGGLVAAVYDVHLDAAPDPADPDDVQQWATVVCRTINEWAHGAHLDQDGRTDGSLLLGWNGRLWTLAEVQAIPHDDGRAALGSGEGPAIGALDVLLEHTACDPVEAVTRACEVGIRRDRYSRAPIQVEILLPAGATVEADVVAGCDR